MTAYVHPLSATASPSLAQIVVVGVEGFDKPAETEVWAAFYDIFVRHAFGSYRELLREVAYSPSYHPLASPFLPSLGLTLPTDSCHRWPTRP